MAPAQPTGSRPPGRDQSAPVERLVRLLGLLSSRPHGVPVDLLLRAVAGDEVVEDTRRRMLTRDIEQLNLLGYDVRNVAEPGAEGRYVLHAQDNRLQVHLDADQRRELLRAALSAGLSGVAPHLGAPSAGDAPTASPGRALDLAQRAVARACLVSFQYKGTPRVVHPARLHSGPSGWYLTGREEGSDLVKEFVVTRMSEVALDAPGSAQPPSDVPHRSLDPLSWLADPATTVEVQLAAEHRSIVENLLGEPVAETADGDGQLRLSFTVTNRAMFRRRLYELGPRVRVAGPEDVRAELLAELRSFAEEDR